MSAPMNEIGLEIPSQHIRQEVCCTRPAYREGRNAKAVKVFTINQESRYLLFQGVPAMGTTHELIKLCAIHGAVEEYRLLDEFPSADKFTDVVLVKFRRIQSARHAKKKLDDWSFFGGVLHVSYAPEYESVQETREKLQDRRKTIAARLRILAKDNSRKKTDIDEKTNHQEKTPNQALNFSNHMTGRIESRIPSSPNMQQTITHDSNKYSASIQYGFHSNNRVETETRNFDQCHFSDHHINNSAVNTFQNQLPVNTTDQGQHLENLAPPFTSGYQEYSDPSQHTFVIPPPPMREPFPNFSRLNSHKQNYDFARVPTANAPYPPDFDARTDSNGLSHNETTYILNERVCKKNSHSVPCETNCNARTDSTVKTDNERSSYLKQTFSKDFSQSVQKDTCSTVRMNYKNENKTKTVSLYSEQHKSSESLKSIQKLNHPKYQKMTEQTVLKGENVIIKEFKKSGSTPKFIPRQMLSVSKLKSVPNKTQAPVKDNDELDQQLRKNAVMLGSTQGPGEVPDEYKKPVKLPTEKAVETTVTEIRKRLSEFSAGPVAKKKVKKED